MATTAVKEDLVTAAGTAVRRRRQFCGGGLFPCERTKTALALPGYPLSISRMVPLRPSSHGFALVAEGLFCGWFSSSPMRLHSIWEFRSGLRESETRRSVKSFLSDRPRALCFFSPFRISLLFLVFKIPRDEPTAAITFVFDDRPATLSPRCLRRAINL